MTTPTISDLIEVTGGKESRNGESVIVGYGPIGYLTLTPDSIILNGEELPAARIEGRLSRRNGGHQADLRAKLKDAGIYIR